MFSEHLPLSLKAQLGFVDLVAGELQLSAELGPAEQRWGRHFDHATSVNPVLLATDLGPATRRVSLEGAPGEESTDIIVTFGFAFGSRVLRWGGRGESCHGFWRYDQMVARKGEWVGMVGIGTLMSEKSAKGTSPNARNFSFCTVQGFRRVFANPSHHQVRRGLPFANLETGEVAGVSAWQHEGVSFSACYYEVPSEEFAAIQDREDMYEFGQTTVRLAGTDDLREGWLCIRTTDEWMRARMGEGAFHEKYGRFGIACWDWKGAILPSRPYLKMCLLAIGSQAGDEAREAFMDDTFLWDQVTTVRQHLLANASLMEEPLPEIWAHLENR